MADEYDLVPVSHDPFPDAQYGQFGGGDPYGDLTRYAHATPLASGGILPVSRYADGSVRFDPHAGLLGPITGMPAAAHQAGMELSGNVPPSTDYPSGPSMDLIGKAADAAGLLTLGAGAVPAEPGSLRAGITAYHGSPHSFDKFSMDAIGTGEGAQAYGHGLYFADNEGVAKGYRDSLSPLQDTDGVNQRAAWGFLNGRNGGDLDAAIESAGRWSSYGEKSPFSRSAKAITPILQDWKANGVPTEQPKLGSMYQVSINGDPEHFLDWDKPLSEQHPKVQGVLRDQFSDIAKTAVDDGYVSGYPKDINDWTGQHFHDAAASVADYAGHGGPRTDLISTMEKLRDAGVPGIKYLDAGSRTAGDGSRNYVVFDDKTIAILKKYGLAGLGLSGGAAAIFGAQPDQAKAAEQ